jgi:hypothetical protein
LLAVDKQQRAAAVVFVIALAWICIATWIHRKPEGAGEKPFKVPTVFP